MSQPALSRGFPTWHFARRGGFRGPSSLCVAGEVVLPDDVSGLAISMPAKPYSALARCRSMSIAYYWVTVHKMVSTTTWEAVVLILSPR